MAIFPILRVGPLGAFSSSDNSFTGTGGIIPINCGTNPWASSNIDDPESGRWEVFRTFDTGGTFFETDYKAELPSVLNSGVTKSGTDTSSSHTIEFAYQATDQFKINISTDASATSGFTTTVSSVRITVGSELVVHRQDLQDEQTDELFDSSNPLHIISENSTGSKPADSAISFSGDITLSPAVVPVLVRIEASASAATTDDDTIQYAFNTTISESIN